jgi:hypothetical protein
MLPNRVSTFFYPVYTAFTQSRLGSAVAPPLSLLLLCGSLLSQAPALSPGEPRTLLRLAGEAKLAGKRQATIGANHGMPLFVRDLAEAVASSTIIVGEPIAAQTVVEHGSSISTWYKFKISETIAQNPSPVGPKLSDLSTEMAPSGLLPIADDEIVGLKNGGRIRLNDVEIVSNNKTFPDFIMNGRYVLFLAASADRLAYMPLAENGAFQLSASGQLLPVGQSDHAVAAGVRDRFANSIEYFRSGLKRPR